MQQQEGSSAGHNGVSSGQLMSYIERVERIREDKKEIGEDEKSIFAEAKANGYDTGAMKRLLKRRSMKPHDLEEMEAIDDMYRHAAGMARDLPLFRSVGQLSADRNAKDAVVSALSQLVPDNGEITLTVGGVKVRIWRDAKGNTHSEDVREPPPGFVPTPDAAHRVERGERPRAEVPEASDTEAKELGRQAARENTPVVKNPFPWDDHRRPLWDAGWREIAGSDGMGPDE